MIIFFFFLFFCKEIFFFAKILMNTSVPLPNVNPRMGRTAYLRAASALSEPPVGTIADITDYVSLFKSKREKQICLNKYYKAQDTKQMMENFSRRAQTALYNRRCEYEINDYKERLSDTKTNEIDFNDTSKTRLVEFEQAAENKLNALKARHEKELQLHEQKKPTVLPAKYRKRSPELINLYRTERKLSIDNNFEEAKMIRAEIDKREAQESKAVMQRAINAWKVEGDHLIEKQRKELEAQHQAALAQTQAENATRLAQLQTAAQTQLTKLKEECKRRLEAQKKEMEEKAKAMPDLGFSSAMMIDPFAGIPTGEEAAGEEAAGAEEAKKDDFDDFGDLGDFTAIEVPVVAPAPTAVSTVSTVSAAGPSAEEEALRAVGVEKRKRNVGKRVAEGGAGADEGRERAEHADRDVQTGADRVDAGNDAADGGEDRGTIDGAGEGEGGAQGGEQAAFGED